MNKQIIAKTARSVRRIFELGAAHLKCAEPHLGGLCGSASFYIYEKLRQLGLKPAFIAGRGHYFVVCDQWLVDVTASQFGQPKIVLRNYERLRQELQARLTNAEWWDEQRRYITLHDIVNDGLIAFRHEAMEIARAAREALKK